LSAIVRSDSQRPICCKAHVPFSCSIVPCLACVLSLLCRCHSAIGDSVVMLQTANEYLSGLYVHNKDIIYSVLCCVVLCRPRPQLVQPHRRLCYSNW
jgi:hypothetical protein